MLNELIWKRAEIDKEILDFISQLIEENLIRLKKNEISESDLINKITEYGKGTKDIIKIYEIVLQINKKYKLKLTKIKDFLAHKYFCSKDKFLEIDHKKLNRARELYNENGNKEMVELIKKLQEELQFISDENWEKLRKYEL